MQISPRDLPKAIAQICKYDKWGILCKSGGKKYGSMSHGQAWVRRCLLNAEGPVMQLRPFIFVFVE